MTKPKALPITARSVIGAARKEIGVRESPSGSNRTRYGVAYGWNGVAWCGIFVWYVFKMAGADLRKFVGPTAGTIAFHGELKSAGWLKVQPEEARPGDVVFFDFGGPNGAESDHVGIVTHNNNTSKNLKTIEGNTSSGDSGSQSNGGGVFDRVRPYGLVMGIWRPPYAVTSRAAKAGASALVALGLWAWLGFPAPLGGTTPSKPAVTVTVTPPASSPTSPGPTPSSTPTVTKTPVKTQPRTKVTVRRVLQSGKCGRDVHALNVRLGAGSGSCFTHRTWVAVGKFQRQHHLKVDRQVGPRTVAKLDTKEQDWIWGG